jgi:hypothetical protein
VVVAGGGAMGWRRRFEGRVERVVAASAKSYDNVRWGQGGETKTNGITRCMNV